MLISRQRIRKILIFMMSLIYKQKHRTVPSLHYTKSSQAYMKISPKIQESKESPWPQILSAEQDGHMLQKALKGGSNWTWLGDL